MFKSKSAIGLLYLCVQASYEIRQKLLLLPLFFNLITANTVLQMQSITTKQTYIKIKFLIYKIIVMYFWYSNSISWNTR